MLSRVEGMSADALAAGVDFAGGRSATSSTGSKAASASTSAANVGHCALRRYVMGDDASERTRHRRRDRPRCRPCCAPRSRDGAVGFTSSQLELHVAHDGRGVPSNHAAPTSWSRSHRCSPSSAAARSSSSPAPSSRATTDDDRLLILRHGPRVGPARAPQHADADARTRPTAGQRSLEFARRGRDRGPRRSTRCSRRNRQGAHFALDTTFLFDEMPSFRDTLTLPAAAARRRGCAIPRVRDRMRAEIADPTRPQRSCSCGRCCGSSRSRDPSTSSYLDRQRHRDRRRTGAPTRSTRSSTSRSTKDLATQFVLAAPPDADAPRRDRGDDRATRS